MSDNYCNEASKRFPHLTDGSNRGVKPNAHAPVGQGGRFEALKEKLSGNVDNPGAVAASIGREKYGKKKFQKMAAKGRKEG